ncbi:putative tyrosyl-DNA phosphodiesterase [Schizosaccharomyces pombe]
MSTLEPEKRRQHEDKSNEIIDSPIFLNKISALPESENVHCLLLKQLIGSPQLKQTWQFNFCVDLNFLLENMHASVFPTVDVRITHGYDSKSDSLARLTAQMNHCPVNVKLYSVYVPMWGTHHSKIMVNFFKDDSCQIVIHTANLVEPDWIGMSQAIFKTPLLYPKANNSLSTSSVPEYGNPSKIRKHEGSLDIKDDRNCDIIDVDSAFENFKHKSDTRSSDDLGVIGRQFQQDFLAYLKNYRHTYELIEKLKMYDFSAIRAIFIGSVPGKFEGEEESSWGLGKLKKILKMVEKDSKKDEKTKFEESDICISQCSSMGSFGPKQEYIAELTDGFGCQRGNWKFLFPTVKEVQQSMLGWQSGSSIHFNILGKTAASQVETLKKGKNLCKWVAMKAGRQRVAPHIKTYMRFSNDGELLRWVLVTSANLSKPAWGTLEGHKAKSRSTRGLRIRSYEAGVLLYPKLFEESQRAPCIMTPTYKTNTPNLDEKRREFYGKRVIGVRMCWDFPPVEYEDKDEIWSPVINRTDKDWLGYVWPPNW